MASGDALPFNAISAIPYLFLGEMRKQTLGLKPSSRFQKFGGYFPTLIRSETMLFACHRCLD
jgi:hypothetical protein